MTSAGSAFRVRQHLRRRTRDELGLALLDLSGLPEALVAFDELDPRSNCSSVIGITERRRVFGLDFACTTIRDA